MSLSQGTFYLWWLLVNAFLYFAEFQFLLRFPAVSKQKWGNGLCVGYIGVNCALTLLALTVLLPVLLRELLHIAVLFLFVICFLKCKWAEAVVSAVILFSLSTFTEGLSAILMRWLRTRLMEPWLGNMLQVLLSVALSILLFMSLLLILKRYGFTARQAVSPYLYVLLLPCAFVIWVIRFGFGLDSMALSDARPPFVDVPLIWALLVIVGAAVAFAMVLNGFDKIITLTQRETDNALLNAQRKEQEIYLAEAQKREEQYRSFQHDIDNHLIILSGLLQDERYGEAKQYFTQLHTVSSALLLRIATGNPVLDVLLGEKISYAKQNHIAVSCHACLPPNLPVNNMDLCIILANALDNAIHACLQDGSTEPDISITVKPRHHFLLLEVTNTIFSAAAISYGTGLTNIHHTVDKYQGTMEIEQAGGRFRLSVLLCLTPIDTLPNT